MGVGQSDQVIIEPLFFPSKDNEQKFIQFLSQAKRYIRICIYTFTNQNIVDKIIQMMRENPKLKIQIIADDAQTINLTKQLEILDEIQKVGNGQVEIKLDNSTASLMHNKYLVIDSDYVATGSFNWTKAAVKTNKENILLIKSKTLVKQFDENFQSLWQEFKFMNDRREEQKQKQINKAGRADQAAKKVEQIKNANLDNPNPTQAETLTKRKKAPKTLKLPKKHKPAKVPKYSKKPSTISKKIKKVTDKMMQKMKKVIQWGRNIPQKIFRRM